MDFKENIDENGDVVEKLQPEETRKFLDNAFRSGELKTIGEDIQKIMPPSNPFEIKSSEKRGCDSCKLRETCKFRKEGKGCGR